MSKYFNMYFIKEEEMWVANKPLKRFSPSLVKIKPQWDTTNHLLKWLNFLKKTWQHRVQHQSVAVFYRPGPGDGVNKRREKEQYPSGYVKTRKAIHRACTHSQAGHPFQEVLKAWARICGFRWASTQELATAKKDTGDPSVEWNKVFHWSKHVSSAKWLLSS